MSLLTILFPKRDNTITLLRKENHGLKMALAECLNIMEPNQWRTIGSALKEYKVLNPIDSKFLDRLFENKEKLHARSNKPQNYNKSKIL